MCSSPHPGHSTSPLPCPTQQVQLTSTATDASVVKTGCISGSSAPTAIRRSWSDCTAPTVSRMSCGNKRGIEMRLSNRTCNLESHKPIKRKHTAFTVQCNKNTYMYNWIHYNASHSLYSRCYYCCCSYKRPTSMCSSEGHNTSQSYG